MSGPTGATVWGVDVGGSTTKALLLAPDGAVLDERRVATPSPDEHGTRVVAAVAALLGDDLGEAVGVVVPGVVDERTGTAVWSANLGSRDVPMLQLLSERLGVPVAFGHDVRAGAVAEAVDGAAAHEPGPVVFLPVGTGVAAAVLVDGKPLVSGGWAGEVGQLVLTGGRRVGEVVEAVGSASALARGAGEPDAQRVAERVSAGDPVAVELWEDAVNALAVALAALVVSVGPTVVVVGGGLAQAGPLLLSPLSSAVAALTPGLRQPMMVPAVHGDLAAARGAAVLAGRLLAERAARPVRVAP